MMVKKILGKIVNLPEKIKRLKLPPLPPHLKTAHSFFNFHKSATERSQDQIALIKVKQ